MGSWLENWGWNPSPRPGPSASRQIACREGLKKLFYLSAKISLYNLKGLGLEAAFTCSILPRLKNLAAIRRTAGLGGKITQQGASSNLEGRKRNQNHQIHHSWVQIHHCGHTDSKLPPPGPPTWPGDYGCINRIWLNICRRGTDRPLGHSHRNLGPSLKLPHSCQKRHEKNISPLHQTFQPARPLF